MEQQAARGTHYPEVAGSNPAPAIMSDELDTTMNENAAGPRRASGDGISVEQHSLADQIALDKHQSAKSATRGRRTPRLMINKISPPGTA